MKVITCISDTDNDGHRQLIRSLKHFGYNYDVLIHPFEFGSQMKWVYEWCKANWGVFLYTDGWDTFALGWPEEIKFDGKMLIAAEKNCYPHAGKAVRYPPCNTEWKYVNGGGFLTDAEYFAKLYEATHQPEDNDQDWLTERLLAGEAELDTKCEVFQTIAFEGINDFDRVIVPGKSSSQWVGQLRMQNRVTGSHPIFIHGNAQTPMRKIYQLLPE